MMSSLGYLAYGAAVSCPDCPSAREARTMFFSTDFLGNIIVTVSPFVVSLAVVVLFVRAVSSRAAKGATGAKDV